MFYNVKQFLTGNGTVLSLLLLLLFISPKSNTLEKYLRDSIIYLGYTLPTSIELSELHKNS